MEPFYQNPETKKREVRESVSRVFAGVGLIVVLIAAGYVGFQAIRQVPSLFSTASTGLLNGERIVVEISPATMDSGATTTVSWTHSGKKSDGSYTLVYDCAPGLSLSRIENGQSEAVFCNVPLHFMNAANSLTLQARSDIEAIISTDITIQYTKNGASRVTEQGVARLTITNPELLPETAATSTDPTQGPTQPGTVQGASVIQGQRTVETFDGGTTPTPRTSDPDGSPDLALTVLAVGVANERTGDFTPATGTIDPDTLGSREVLAVQFAVENLGTKESGVWEFEAELPTRPREDFESRPQDSLFPGERIEFVLGFDRHRSDTVLDVVIHVDHENNIDEASEANNKLTARIVTNQ